MADREPRRRKKRKDSTKKEDHHTEDPSAMTFHKFEHKDLDQDADEDIIIPPSHQPSQLAQIVFMILFLALAGIMSSVFIALHGSSSQLDVFSGEEDHHADVEQTLPDVDADHTHSHEEEELIDIFPDLMKQFQAVVSGGETEENVSGQEKETIVSDKITISDFIEKPSIVNTDEAISDIHNGDELIEEHTNIEIDEMNNNVEIVESINAPISESSAISPNIEEKIQEEIEIIQFPKEEVIQIPKEEIIQLPKEEIIQLPKEEVTERTEDTIATQSEVNQNLIKDELTNPVSESIEDLKTDSKNDDTNNKNIENKESFTKSESDVSNNVPNKSNGEESAEYKKRVVEGDNEDDDESLELPDDKTSLFEEYENDDITNKADYDIKEQLDEIEKIIEKEMFLDDEEEDYANDEKIDPEDEFDFWQF